MDFDDNFDDAYNMPISGYKMGPHLPETIKLMSENRKGKGLRKGLLTVRDKNGRCFLIDKNDKNDDNKKESPTKTTYTRDFPQSIKPNKSEYNNSVVKQNTTPNTATNAITTKSPVPTPVTQYQYINTSGKEIFATLEVKPTSNVDVYKINSVERTNIDGKKILKRIQMGIAYISGINQSHKLKQIFQNNGGKQILMKCKFNDDKNKWEPLEIDSVAKHPTFINDIDLEMMEMSDSDD